MIMLKVQRLSQHFPPKTKLVLSGVWLGADLRSNTKEIMCLKESRLRAHDLLTILGLTVNGIGWALHDHLVRKRNVHFDSELAIHASSKHYEENYCEHNLNFLIILH